MYIHKYIFVYAHISYIYIYTNIYIRTSIYTYMYMYIYLYIYIYIYKCINIHIYTYIKIFSKFDRWKNHLEIKILYIQCLHFFYKKEFLNFQKKCFYSVYTTPHGSLTQYGPIKSRKHWIFSNLYNHWFFNPFRDFEWAYYGYVHRWYHIHVYTYK
jgi:hypothetical protein